MSGPGRVLAVRAGDGSVIGLLLADAVTRGEVELGAELAACLPGARAGITLERLATHGSRAFVALRPASGRAVAAVANSRKAPDRPAVAQLNS